MGNLQPTHLFSILIALCVRHCSSHRLLLQALESTVSPTENGEDEANTDGEEEGEEGIGLGTILGLGFLVCCILYCIGISYKIYKIWKGTYVEEEPVFLKYK